jgi:hypothetical protein
MVRCHSSVTFLDCLRKCRQLGVVPGRFVVVINVARQTAWLFQKPVAFACPICGNRHYDPVKGFRCSTSRFGIGQATGSNLTPLGLHRIAEKIGGGWPVGTAFKSRQAVGHTWRGMPGAKITSRILWLEGLEPGVNRGGDVDSRARFIYIHGTGDEPALGRPASCGCIHLAADDLIPLFDTLPTGTLVWIAER